MPNLPSLNLLVNRLF